MEMPVNTFKRAMREARPQIGLWCSSCSNVTAEAIAAVDGVDGLFIGPSDLAAALGHLGDNGHPEVRAAIEDAVQRIRKTGKAAGILASLEADARHWLAQGCTVVAVGSDLGLLARSSEALAAKFKN